MVARTVGRPSPISKTTPKITGKSLCSRVDLGHDIGSEFAFLFCDVDCVDALKVQRFVVGLPVGQLEPCTVLGFPVQGPAT